MFKNIRCNQFGYIYGLFWKYDIYLNIYKYQATTLLKTSMRNQFGYMQQEACF